MRLRIRTSFWIGRSKCGLLLAMTALVVLATGCPLDRIHTTRGATIVAFGVSGPEEPQYYDHAAAALDTHLKSQGFVVSTRPNFATVYVNDNKRRTWYYQSSS